VDGFIDSLKSRQALEYQLIQVLDVFWLDRTRPEMMLRNFRTIKNFDRRSEAVYVYRRVTPRQLK
jgi:hypothetical protein